MMLHYRQNLTETYLKQINKLFFPKWNDEDCKHLNTLYSFDLFNLLLCIYHVIYLLFWMTINKIRLKSTLLHKLSLTYHLQYFTKTTVRKFHECCGYYLQQKGHQLSKPFCYCYFRRTWHENRYYEITSYFTCPTFVIVTTKTLTQLQLYKRKMIWRVNRLQLLNKESSNQNIHHSLVLTKHQMTYD